MDEEQKTYYKLYYEYFRKYPDVPEVKTAEYLRVCVKKGEKFYTTKGWWKRLVGKEVFKKRRSNKYPNNIKYIEDVSKEFASEVIFIDLL